MRHEVGEVGPAVVVAAGEFGDSGRVVGEDERGFQQSDGDEIENEARMSHRSITVSREPRRPPNRLGFGRPALAL
jgi:hypothetical protein